MDFITLSLLCIVLYTIYYYFIKRLKYFEELGIPYVPPVPLLGNLAAPTFRRRHFVDTIKDIYNYHPNAKYVGFFNFVRPVIMVRDPELIKSITIKNFDNFQDHQTFVDVSVDPIFGGNLFGMSGASWREARNLLTPAFTSSKMKSMYDLMAVCVQNLINHISEQAKNPNNEIATKDLFTKYTNDVIATCAFAMNVDSLKDPNNQFYRLGREATNLEGSLSYKLFLSRAFPQLMKFFKIKIVADHVAEFFKDVVAQTIKHRDENGISRTDVIQLLMDARGKTSDLLKLDIVEITSQAFVFFFAGFDLTSTQMCILAQELTINQDVQRKLQEEIDRVMEKTQGKPSYEDIHSMAYLDAVFNETIRKHPQGIFLDRLCTKAFEFPPAVPGGKPFTVTPGMNIWIPIAGIHFDEKYHTNPEKFDPNRYLNKKVSVNQVENLGFGIGPRSCIGYRFAILEIKILFFHLLHNFNLKPNSKTCIPFEYNKSRIAIAAKGGYWLTLESRKVK